MDLSEKTPFPRDPPLKQCDNGRRRELSGTGAIPPPYRAIGYSYMGWVQNVWGEENVPENAPSRKILDPSKELLVCSVVDFCT